MKNIEQKLKEIQDRLDSSDTDTFIVNSKNDIRWLLQEIESLQKALAFKNNTQVTGFCPICEARAREEKSKNVL